MIMALKHLIGTGVDPSTCYCFVILSLAVITLNVQLTTGSEASEIAANSVEITFYQLKQSKWSGAEGGFKEAVSSGMNTYCEANYLSCGLGQWLSSYSFTSAEVTVTETEILDGYLNVTLYVSYHGNVPDWQTNVTDHIVNKAAVVEAFRAAREDINDAVGYYIVAVDSDEYRPAPDNFMNMIMIPIGFVILLALIIITVALYYWRKHQNKLEVRAEIRSKKRQKMCKSSDYKAVMKQKEERSSPSNTKPPSRVGPAPNEDPETGYDRDDQSYERGHSAQSHSSAEELVRERPPGGAAQSTTFNFMVSGSMMPRGENDSFGGNQTDETILNLPDTHTRKTSLPPLEGDKSNDRRKHRKHKKKHAEKNRLRQESDIDIQGTEGQYRSREDTRFAPTGQHRGDPGLPPPGPGLPPPGPDLPPPAQYHKQTYDTSEPNSPHESIPSHSYAGF